MTERSSCSRGAHATANGRRPAQQQVLLFLLLSVAVSLQGCETAEEGLLRTSCSWTSDAALIGCEASGFSSCASDCEYCLYGTGSKDRGRQDECAQLKCAAYCAKRNGGAPCLATFTPMCSAGVNLLRTQDGKECNVDCSAASKSPGLSVLPLALGLLVVSWAAGAPGASTSQEGRAVPESQGGGEEGRGSAVRAVLMAGALWATISLQGCMVCPVPVPSLSNFDVDLDQMDRDSGCKQGWGALWGNPCASDVPILWAKKGIYKDADLSLIKGSVANKDYLCLKRDGPGFGYCSMWTRYDPHCDSNNFGVCTCNAAGGVTGANFCQAWRCITKMVSQQYCYIFTSQDGQRIACKPAGSAPLPMDLGTYQALLNAEESSNITTISQTDALRLLRRGFSNQYYFNDDCILSRDISSVSETACNTWRTIKTELQFCECTKKDESSRYCAAWSCENKKLGIFSILFAESRSYGDVVAGLLKKDYECTASVTTALDLSTAICSSYHGHSSGFLEVNAFQCEGCSSMKEDCNRWLCNEYKLDRIQDEDQWWKRLLFLGIHWLWISFFVVPPSFVVATIRLDRDTGRAITGCVASFVGVWFSILLIWLIGFVRSTDFGARAPALPFLGLMVMLLPPWLVAAAWGFTPWATPAQGAVLPLCAFTVALVYTNGLVPLMVLVVAPLLVRGARGLVVACRGK